MIDGPRRAGAEYMVRRRRINNQSGDLGLQADGTAGCVLRLPRASLVLGERVSGACGRSPLAIVWIFMRAAQEGHLAYPVWK